MSPSRDHVAKTPQLYIRGPGANLPECTKSSKGPKVFNLTGQGGWQVNGDLPAVDGSIPVFKDSLPKNLVSIVMNLETTDHPVFQHEGMAFGVFWG